jgi:hypothetical protein
LFDQRDRASRHAYALQLGYKTIKVGARSAGYYVNAQHKIEGLTFEWERLLPAEDESISGHRKFGPGDI